MVYLPEVRHPHRMIRVVTAEDLKIGDVVHPHTDTDVVRIRLVKIERRRSGFNMMALLTVPWRCHRGSRQPP